MLGLAIKSGIPIIRVTTTDVLNVQQVLEHLVGGEVAEWRGTARGDADVFYAIDETEIDAGHYQRLVQEDKVLVLINQGEDSPYAFNAGEMPVPEKLQSDLLAKMISEKEIPALLPSFRGLTLKAMAEVMRLTFTDNKKEKLTPRAVTAMRARVMGSVLGLQQVDTTLPVYLPAKRLTEWIELNKSYFITPTNLQLIPRGVLFNGEPGTGKTQGAKHIANELGVPLYRLDLSSTLSKWRGGSEQNLSRALATIDQENGACLLIDEAEKIFDTEHDDGGTGRLLGQLLFWLHEHKSRVLTIMTTNNIGKLPKELYRPGRIDIVITLPLLTEKEAYSLADRVFLHLMPKGNAKNVKAHAMYDKVKWAMNGEKKITHAEVTAAVQNYVKEVGLTK